MRTSSRNEPPRTVWRARRCTFGLVVAFAASAACREQPVAADAAAAPPAGGEPAASLLLVTIDTLRADHLGCYGYARNTSPRMDRLAQEGTLFTQAEVQWPKTVPSIVSMMTSTYSATNRVRSLRGRLDDRPIFIESQGEQYAVRLGRWKYIEDPRKTHSWVPIVGREQLYDLEADPLERENMIATHLQVAEELRGLLERWKAGERNPTTQFEAEPVPDEELDPETIEQLRSLGYLGKRG